ncbi:hypothetical protein RJ639_022068 [Escallonia herrerae]|uniref:Cell division control protein 24 OB domain-containing protein n=1 Tax=Escallonia herrerae TaxID=1293975 RepID=A0AA88V776_9ASTE|nr:hypothetical protein RJ639_022068 [Escallonia herrerae]
MLSALDPSQASKVSQITLPCDSQGSIDFSSYPFRSFVVDLRDKMTSISLYGVVADISRENNDAAATFSLRIEDSLGRLGLGHTVHFWLDMFRVKAKPICRVWLDQIEHCHVNTRLSHALCGYFLNKTTGEDVYCSFCCRNCDAAEVARTFHLKITLADESAKVSAWCTGQTATELLQISPDEFYELPEEEQIMYPSSRFAVALVNCRRQGYGLADGLMQEDDMLKWEITRALKSG